MGERILVTGASGFVGQHVVAELLKRGHSVSAVVGKRRLEPAKGLTVFSGRLASDVLEKAAEGCGAAVHLVGIIFEHSKEGQTFEKVHIEGTRRVLEVCRAAGVRRYVHMSALGSRPNAVSRYHQTKWAAEELVRGQGMPWTIFRPSLIHGPGGEFTQMQLGWALGTQPPWFFMPYFAGGVLGLGKSGLLQPVMVDDVAVSFVDAVAKPETAGNAYDLVGEQVLSWPELHRAFSGAVLGRPKRVLAIPVWYARLLTKVVPGAWLPFNVDQVVMAAEDNTGDKVPWAAASGLRNVGYAEGVGRYSGVLARSTR